jgi:hypothetical protein
MALAPRNREQMPLLEALMEFSRHKFLNGTPQA